MNKPINYSPLVSVYIPTYNRIDLLIRAVESVQKQTYTNLEIIVVDDCSSDGTQEYLKQVAHTDNRVRYILKDKNSGACVSRNIAIRNAKGFFITGLDDDDYFEKNRIKVFLENALKDDSKIYFTSFKVKVSKEEIREPNFLNIFKKTKYKSYRLLLNRNFIGNQSFMKTELLRKSGGFDESLKAWQDLECWYNLIKTQKTEAIYIKKPTQTLDVSHEHERITNKNLNNVVEAYHYISKKHSLGFFEKTIFENQLVRYMPKKYSHSKKIFFFIITGNLFLLKSILINQ